MMGCVDSGDTVLISICVNTVGAALWHPAHDALIRGFEDDCSYESYVIRCHPGGDDEKVVGSPGLQDSR